MSADQIKIVIDADTREAIANLTKLKDSIGEVEKAAKKLSAGQQVWKLLTTDVDKLGNALSSAHPRLGAFAGGVANVAKGVATGATAMVAFGAALAKAAAEAEKNDIAIRRLGNAYDAVSIATNGAMSARQALTLQGQIQAAGVQVNAQQLALLTRAAREYAIATGNDASEAVEKLTNAIVNNSEDALSELNLAQARSTSSTQTLTNVTRELEERFRGVAPAARSLNEDLAKLPEVASMIAGSFANAAAGGIRSFIDAIHGAGTAARTWRDIVELADTNRTVDRQRATDASRAALRDRRDAMLRRLNAAGVEIPESLRGQLGRGLNNADDRELAALGRALDQSQRQRGRGAGVLLPSASDGAGFDANFDGVRAISDSANEARYAFARAARESFGLMNAAIADESRKREPATARGVRALDELKIKLNETTAAVQHAGESLAHFKLRLDASKPGQTVDALLDYYRGDQFRQQNAFEVDADRAAASIATALGIDRNEGLDLDGIASSMEGGGSAARASRSTASRRAARDRQTRIQSVSQGRSVGAGIQRGLGVSADALETEAKLTQGYADSIVGAFDKIGSAITRHVELVASGQETIGQAVLAGTHEVTKAIAMEALPRSLMELAAGFAALANPVTAATAPLHFTAAAVYGGVAAGAGLVAGVTGALGGAGAPAAAAGATGAARAASGATPPPREEAAAPVSIYLNSTVPPGPRELQTLVAATRQSNRYQLDSRAQMVPRSVRA